jgi:RNA:NAD 2'-phosphotransferase (TPT1/KptA family)
MADKNISDTEQQTVVLIAVLMNAMAVADRYESLQEVLTIDPAHIDLYARYSHAALDGFAKYQKLPKTDQTPDAAVFFMSAAIASTDGIVPVKKKHIHHAKAAQLALQACQDHLKKQALFKEKQGAEHE